MASRLENLLAWGTAFAIVFSLYAHTFFDAASAEVTPLSAAAIAIGLVAGSVLWARRPTFMIPVLASRQLGAFCLWVAWMAFTALGLLGFVDRAPTINDWGRLLLTVGLPALLLCSYSRAALLNAIGICCVAFALADLVANIGALMGTWTLADAGSRREEFGFFDRYGGLTGNSHASGLVAFVAVAFLGPEVRQRKTWFRAATALMAILLVVFSLYLIDARRYVVGAVAVLALLWTPLPKRAPLWAASLAIGLGGVLYTFSSFDLEEMQRANLMAAGFSDSAKTIAAGTGIFYKAAPAGIRFTDLWSVGVTESGILDLAIQFGWVATTIFLAGIAWALSGWRAGLTWTTALITVLVGEMAYADPFEGFLGATVFFAALISIICDESAELRLLGAGAFALDDPRTGPARQPQSSAQPAQPSRL